MSRAPYWYPSIATNTCGSICPKRSITARTPNSGAQLDHTPPSDAVARNATSVSGMFGAYATTRTPGPTPRRRNPAAQRRTRSASSDHVSSMRPRVWLSATTATTSPSSPADASAWSAKLSVAPGNQRTPGIVSPSRIASGGRIQRRPVNAVTARQKSSPWAIDHASNPSASRANPHSAAKRPNAVVSQQSSGGVHSTSPRTAVLIGAPPIRATSRSR